MSDLIDPDAGVKPGAPSGEPGSNGKAGGIQASRKPVSGRPRKGKCNNVGECSNAGIVIEVAEGDSFVCPECGSELLPERGRRVGGRRKLLVLAVLVGALCLLGVVSYFALGPFAASLIGKKTGGGGSATAGTGEPPPIEKKEEPPPEKKPTLAEAEAALRQDLPKGISLVSLKPSEEQKGPDGSWNLAYEATVVAENNQYWVPIADLDAARLAKRLSEVPSPERSWARRHLKDLILTQDQAPGQEYLFSRKKPLASLVSGSPFPFAWKAVATQNGDGSWKFVPASPLPFSAPPPSEGGADMRVVLRSSPELDQAQVLAEQRWDRFVGRLKEIEREARQRYGEVMNNAPSRVRKPDVFREGSGGPTTIAEGAGIGAAGGALGGAMLGGGTGAAIGAGLGLLFGGLGGGIYSHQKQQKRYEAALAERRRYEQEASSAVRNAREHLLAQYGQELEERAQQRLAQLESGSSGASNPSSPGGNSTNPEGAPPAMPPYSSDGGPPPMPPMPTQEPVGSPAGVPPFGGGSPLPPAEGAGPPPPPPPPPPPF